MTDDDNRAARHPTDAADDRGVVRVHAVAVQFLKIRDDARNVVGRIGPHRVPRDLGNLPGRQLGEDALRERFALALQPGDLLVDIDLGVIADVAQLVDLCLELGNRLFEFEKLEVHGR